MIGLSMGEFIQVCGGRLLHGSGDDRFLGVSIDTRSLESGELFFALKGESSDGHRYVGEAIRRGAAGAVISDAEAAVGVNAGSLLLVDSPQDTLQQLASWWRQRYDIPVVAVTGSSGKTSTKDILAGVLTVLGPVQKTSGNYNNELGVPLTLLKLDASHRSCVVEMAMRSLGEIAQLCRLAEPTGGIITNVGTTHYELLGSVENIARAKGELAASLKPEGFLVLNADDRWSGYISRMTQARTVYFGLAEQADVRAVDLRTGSRETVFTLMAHGGSWRLSVPLLGRHSVYNCLAAISAALELGVKGDQLQEGLKQISLTGMRMERTAGPKGSVIINDTYNANPDSMRASLEVLALEKNAKRFAVLGDMLELGEIEDREHQRIGQVVEGLGIDYLLTVGRLAASTGRAALESGMSQQRVFILDTAKEAIDIVKNLLDKGDVVLVKGSRGMRMEEIVKGLTGIKE